MDVDAIVVGAGAAGLMGALSAAHRGARVLLLEKDLAGPSNLLVSGGLFPGAGTRFQRAAGVADDPGAYARDIRAKALGSTNESIVDAVARGSVQVVDFMADTLGIELHLVELVAPGHGVARLHATPAESGRELHALLRAAAARHPRIEMRDRAAFRPDESNLKRQPVLLATGGFAGNARMLAEFIPQAAGALHIGAGPNDGCAIEWGRALGAGVALMDGYQGQGHVNPGTGTRLGMALPALGAFMVNREGRAFVGPEVGPSELAARVLAQPGGVALEVFDRAIHDKAMKQGPYAEACKAGVVMVADDPPALARLAGLPEAVFLESFEQRGKRLAPPLHASWVTGALAHTQGGLRVDARARVLRPDGTPIEGLFAAGGAAAGLAGRGGEGYLPGNGLGQAFALGLAAGEEIASLHLRA